MLIDTLPHVARHVLRLIAGRKTASIQMLKSEIELASDLTPALELLKRHQLIELVKLSYRITQAGLDCVSGTEPEPCSKPTKSAPICNASTKAPYTGAELRPFSGRLGAMSAYDLPSRTGQARRWPDGRVTALVGEQATT